MFYDKGWFARTETARRFGEAKRLRDEGSKPQNKILLRRKEEWVMYTHMYV